ncbi:MAG: hypothetical protein AB7S26_23490 [Sandaracinaceae bacterium]
MAGSDPVEERITPEGEILLSHGASQVSLRFWPGVRYARVVGHLTRELAVAWLACQEGVLSSIEGMAPMDLYTDTLGMTSFDGVCHELFGEWHRAHRARIAEIVVLENSVFVKLGVRIATVISGLESDLESRRGEFARRLQARTGDHGIEALAASA